MRIILVILVVIAAALADPAGDQLENFKLKTSCPIGILTTANGAPVEESDTRVLNSNLMSNTFLVEGLSHMVRQNIPERIVHVKGAGAFGHFVVTHNITNFCKAKLFSKIGKKTPVFVRFSQSSLDKGEADTNLDSRGFAIKFYTEEGNFDIVGFNTPMFMYKEPLLFLPIGRVIRRNPVTNLRDPHMLWDLICLRPETLSFFLFLFGGAGFPCGYRHMPGFSIHTYQVYNEFGESYFMRFHIIPDKGIKNLFAETAQKLACVDPDYAVRDLYNAIARGDFPSWTVSVQVLTLEDVKKCKFDVFDITKVLPEDEFPLQPVGKLVLNKNPNNFFATVEQSAFCPGNVVPGVMGSPDKAFETRQFAYKDAQRYRLGVNFHQIQVNCPLNPVFSYNRDGRAPVFNNGGGSPNYFPNSYHGPVPYVDKKRPKLITIKQYDDSHDFEQISEIYNKLSNDERNRMAQNLVFSIKNVNKDLQDRVTQLFGCVHSDLAYRVTVGLAAAKGDC